MERTLKQMDKDFERYVKVRVKGKQERAKQWDKIFKELEQMDKAR